MSNVYTGNLSKIDDQVLEVLKRLPDDFWIFAEFNVNGRNVDFLILRQVPPEQRLKQHSTLILTELKRLSGPLSGTNENAVWSHPDETGRPKPIELSNGDTNFYCQAVNTTNAVADWLWVNQPLYLDGVDDEPKDNFKVWPDLLLLSPPGTKHLLPIKPLTNYGYWYYGLEPWSRHLLGWDPNRAPFGIGLTEDNIRKIAGALGLARIWPQPTSDSSGLLEALGPKNGATNNIDDRVTSLEQRLRALESMLAATQQQLSERQAFVIKPEVQIARPYVACDFPAQGNQEAFWLSNSANLAHLVGRCVAVETPVHERRAMQVVASSFGISKLGSRISERLLQAIDLATRTENVARRENGFLWANGMIVPPIRTIDPEIRAISEVAPEEMEAAVFEVLRSGSPMIRSHVHDAVARTFGYKRTTRQIAEVISAAIGSLVADSLVADIGGELRMRGKVT